MSTPTTQPCPATQSREMKPCPRNGLTGKPVGWRTVAALTKVAVPPRGDYWLCRDPACEVVYFSGDRTLGRGDLIVDPGFKSGGDDLLCYCFRHRRLEVAEELAVTGETTVPASIRAAMSSGGCACEVRNPSGGCCLGEVETAVTELRSELAERFGDRRLPTEDHPPDLSGSAAPAPRCSHGERPVSPARSRPRRSPSRSGRRRHMP